MGVSRKYGRTFHFDFSPGTTSDDRINREWWDDISKVENVIHTEKLDGENTCQNGIGIFARSHAAPTRHPWSDYLKPKFSMIQNDLKEGNIELFGENIYAIHSIIYPNIEHHFYIFGVRVLDTWLSWEEVQWYADFFEFPTVPVIGQHKVSDITKDALKDYVIENALLPSAFGSLQNGDDIKPCSMEGIVTRNLDEYAVDDMAKNVFKYVRKDHVQTDQHWSRNWKRASLNWEKNEK